MPIINKYTFIVVKLFNLFNSQAFRSLYALIILLKGPPIVLKTKKNTKDSKLFVLFTSSFSIDWD